MAGFKFGNTSKSNQIGLHPDLRTVLAFTIRRTTKDFTVYNGGRTMAEQQENVKNGASDTLDSDHLPDKFGVFHAVDCVPLTNHKSDWRPQAYLPIVSQYFLAAHHYGIPLDWGGWWVNTSFGKDLAHIALERDHYPRNGQVSTWQSRAAAGYKLCCNPDTGKFDHVEHFEPVSFSAVVTA